MSTDLIALWGYAVSYVVNAVPELTTIGEEEEKEVAETDDDTIVCRALRKYYVASGRPFPYWLSPSPCQHEEGASVKQSHKLRGRRSILSDLWDLPNTTDEQPGRAGLPASKRYSAMLRQCQSIHAIGEAKEQTRQTHVPNEAMYTVHAAHPIENQVLSGSTVVAPVENTSSPRVGQGSHLNIGSLRTKKASAGVKMPATTWTKS